jgi:hypothetical protein
MKLHETSCPDIIWHRVKSALAGSYEHGIELNDIEMRQHHILNICLLRVLLHGFHQISVDMAS